jgi:hypothetical protein
MSFPWNETNVISHPNNIIFQPSGGLVRLSQHANTFTTIKETDNTVKYSKFNTIPMSLNSLKTITYTHPTYVEGRSTVRYSGQVFNSADFKFTTPIRGSFTRLRMLAVCEPMQPGTYADGFLSVGLQRVLPTTSLLYESTINPGNQARRFISYTRNIDTNSIINTNDTYRWRCVTNHQGGTTSAWWFRFYIRFFID